MSGETSGLTIDAALKTLSHGEIRVGQQIAWSSNATFLVEVSDGDRALHAVYKPRRGERPLWDFPEGTLCLREMAAFVVSEALGWHIVPPTVLRDGPFGFGALQVFIAHDPDDHYLALTGPQPDTILAIAAFDLVVNNADRKSGHVLRDPGGDLWAIDHGVCFHVEPKLRTVIWDFAGRDVPEPLIEDLRSFADLLFGGSGETRAALSELLSGPEIDALAIRTRALVAVPVFPPADPTRRVVPWPPV